MIRSAQSCSSSCSSLTACRHWSWRGGRCELRTALASKQTRLGSISGTVGEEDCVRGVECHYSGHSHLVSCILGNITKYLSPLTSLKHSLPLSGPQVR